MTKDFSLFSVALKNIGRKPVRTVMLVVSIMLLVSTLVFALSFIYRVHSGIRIMSDRLGADILIVPAGSRGPAEEVLLENKVKTFYMDKGILDKVLKIKGIEKATYQTYLATLTGLCCSVPESIVVAFDQGSDFIIAPWLSKKLGRRLQKGEAVVGNESAFNIDVGLMEVDSVLFGSVFKMVGVLDKTGTGLDNAIFIGDENIEDILKQGTPGMKPGQISIIFVKVKKGVDPRKVAGEIQDNIIEVNTVTRKDIGKSIIATLRDISRIFTVTVVLTSILSAFLAWTVFSAIAHERSREIGIMRAIGAKESHIMKIFFAEVVIIGAAGSVLGIFSGTLVSFFLSKSFALLKNITTDLQAFERVCIALIGLLVGTGVCIIGALSPISRTKKVEPLIVLKGE